MSKVLKKSELEHDVLTAARARFADLYKRFDKVVVSFSGGKDSTVCLQLAIEAATAAGRLPVEAMFFDEEAIHPTTIEYVERVRQRKDVALDWYCVQIKHRNACSRRDPYWYTWDDTEEARWCRPLPERVIRDFDGFQKGMSMPEAVPLIYRNYKGMVAHVRGIRADESLRRYRSVALREADNWINGPIRTRWSKASKGWEWSQGGNSYMTSPIYDWTTLDVWFAPKEFGWDYNTTYDLFDMAGMTPHQQRVCPPYGEEPLGGLWVYHVCFPDLWDRMIGRVHGAATAGRYARTELYGFGDMQLPPGHTWQSYTLAALDLYPPKYKAKIATSVRTLVERHREKTSQPIHETEPHIKTGVSWRYLAMLVNRGDMKNRRTESATSKATAMQQARGVAYADIDEQDSGTRY
jgi:predicted phosphoadenosine phosphosulfate sulfurtransferase